MKKKIITEFKLSSNTRTDGTTLGVPYYSERRSLNCPRITITRVLKCFGACSSNEEHSCLPSSSKVLEFVQICCSCAAELHSSEGLPLAARLPPLDVSNLRVSEQSEGSPRRREEK